MKGAESRRLFEDLFTDYMYEGGHDCIIIHNLCQCKCKLLEHVLEDFKRVGKRSSLHFPFIENLILHIK